MNLLDRDTDRDGPVMAKDPRRFAVPDCKTSHNQFQIGQGGGMVRQVEAQIARNSWLLRSISTKRWRIVSRDARIGELSGVSLNKSNARQDSPNR